MSLRGDWQPPRGRPELSMWVWIWSTMLLALFFCRLPEGIATSAICMIHKWLSSSLLVALWLVTINVHCGWSVHVQPLRTHINEIVLLLLCDRICVDISFSCSSGFILICCSYLKHVRGSHTSEWERTRFEGGTVAPPCGSSGYEHWFPPVKAARQTNILKENLLVLFVSRPLNRIFEG